MSENRYNASIRAIGMPPSIARLPISPQGFPTPWFVHFGEDGIPDFRVIGRNKMRDAVKHKLCWVCGEPLYPKRQALVLGPMCAINRTISEPASHPGCAIYSVTACPFLSKPGMRRNEKDLPDHVPATGIGIKRNPMAAAVWITDKVTPFAVDGGILFTFSDPIYVRWYSEGRTATRAEVDHSIGTGLPLLMEAAVKEGPDAIAALNLMVRQAQKYLPAA